MDSSNVQHKLEYRGFLHGHGGWVTCLQIGEEVVGGSQDAKEFLISGSRDKSLMIWDIIERKQEDEDKEWGAPRRILKGHSHFISDLKLSGDSRYCLSSSWDGSLRLWDIRKGVTTRRFVSHSKDVLTVAFSADNRQIASGGRDRKLKIWNTLGECKFTVKDNEHQDWVSCVKFYQDPKTPIVVSASWDKTIKVWDNNTMALKYTFTGHTAQINSLDMAPKTSYLASGSKDGKAFIWNLVEGRFLGQCEAGCSINCVLFAPKKYWLVLGTDEGIKVWDLPKKEFIVDIKASPLHPTQENMKKSIGCLSLAWNKSGNLLFAGFTDNYIRVYQIVEIK